MGGSILMQRKIRCRKFPSPHSGILFLCENRRVPPGGKTGRVSVPSFGDSFFISYEAFSIRRPVFQVSVPSFGDSFFIKEINGRIRKEKNSFRPLIRGFFFYVRMVTVALYRLIVNGFRPLIRGFFFYVHQKPSQKPLAG